MFKKKQSFKTRSKQIEVTQELLKLNEYIIVPGYFYWINESRRDAFAIHLEGVTR